MFISPKFSPLCVMACLVLRRLRHSHHRSAKVPRTRKNAALQTLDNKGDVGPFRALLVPGPSRRFASKHRRHCHIFHFLLISAISQPTCIRASSSVQAFWCDFRFPLAVCGSCRPGNAREKSNTRQISDHEPGTGECELGVERRDFSSCLDQALAVVSESYVFACPNTDECVASFLMQTFYPPVLAI